MNAIVKLALGALLLLGVAAGGYWLGTRSDASEVTAKAERKVLYYRNPMGLPDTSPVPKTDAMGMDYVPVYEGEAEAAGADTITISPDRVQKLGVKSEAAALRELRQTLNLTGRIEVDERRTYTVAPKFEGWVEHLYANATGQTVGKDQPLFEVYSPELVSAQREHALAVQGLAAMKDADDEAKESMQRLIDASRARLQNWDIAPHAATGGDLRPRATYRTPVSGVVLEKKAVQGMRFMPGEMLYQIADLSLVWVIADVPEQDIGAVQPGSPVQVAVDAYPERSFAGRVGFIYPVLDAATRTAQVRIEVGNAQGLLKPAMYAKVQIAGKGGKVLAVPDSAVIDSGLRQVVLLRLAEGRFEPRTVTIGRHGDGHAEVLSGLAEGEQVVTSANFLIDAESNLKAALRGLGEHVPPAAEEHAAHAAPAQPAHKTVDHEAQGILEAVHNDGTVSITHQPIESLGWPGMTMDFTLANTALTKNIPPGSAISFEIVERKPDEWVVTRMSVRASQEGSHAEHRH